MTSIAIDVVDFGHSSFTVIVGIILGIKIMPEFYIAFFNFAASKFGRLGLYVENWIWTVRFLIYICIIAGIILFFDSLLEYNCKFLFLEFTELR